MAAREVGLLDPVKGSHRLKAAFLEYFGTLSERLGGGIGDMLDGNYGGSQVRKTSRQEPYNGFAIKTLFQQSRRKRSPLTTAEQEAKEYLDQFDFRVGPQASEVICAIASWDIRPKSDILFRWRKDSSSSRSQSKRRHYRR